MFWRSQLNHLIDRRIDAIMARTKGRPLAAGRIPAPAGGFMGGGLNHCQHGHFNLMGEYSCGLYLAF